MKSVKIKIKDKELQLNGEEISKLNLDIKKNIIENYSILDNKPFKEIKRNKVKFNVLYDPELIEFWKKYEVNKWENELISTIEKYVSKERYFIDIGAWIGPITLYASKFASKIIAFEPDPIAFNILKKNIELNKNTGIFEKINLNQMAVGTDKNKTIDLYSSNFCNSGTSSILDKNLDKITVKSITLPDVVKKFNLEKEKIFFKIDIEGAEYDLLIKNLDLLKRLDCNLHFSLHPKNLAKQFYKNNKSKFIGVFFYISTYFKIIRKLPFKYILVNEKKISIIKLIIKSILYGLPGEVHIMCVNKLTK